MAEGDVAAWLVPSLNEPNQSRRLRGTDVKEPSWRSVLFAPTAGASIIYTTLVGRIARLNPQKYTCKSGSTEWIWIHICL